METGTEQQGLDTAWMERILAASAAAAASGANTIFPATSELVMRQLQTLYAQQALILQVGSSIGGSIGSDYWSRASTNIYWRW